MSIRRIIAALATGTMLVSSHVAFAQIGGAGLNELRLTGSLGDMRRAIGLGSATTAIYYAKNYGACTWSATTDVGTCANLAIAAAAAAGGGIVVLPAGVYGLETTVSITSSSVGLQCEMGSITGGSGSPTANTKGCELKWLGVSGGRMMYVGTNVGQLISNSVRNIRFNGNNGLAADGLYLASVFGGHFDDIVFVGGFNGGNVVNLTVDAVTGGGAQNNTLDNLYIDNGSGGTYTSTQLRLGTFIDGTGVHGNAAFNLFRNLFVGGHSSSTSIACVGCDNNQFELGRVFNAGVSIDLTIAQSGANLFPANGNVFNHFQFIGEAYARGTTSFAACVAYVTCTYNNNFIDFDQTNGTTVDNFTIETAADIKFSSNSGYSYGSSFIGKVSVRPALIAAHDYSIWGGCASNGVLYEPSSAAYFCNSVSGALLAFDSIQGDRFNVAFSGLAGSSNMRFTRTAGTGVFQFVQKLQLDDGMRGRGSHETAAYDSVTYGQFVAEAENYASSFTSTAILQYGTAAPGTTLGLSNASLGLLSFLNTAAATVSTNNSIPLTLGTNGVARAEIPLSGSLRLLGTTSGGVTLAVPATAGTNTITLPAGTTNFSTTGPGVVSQASAGSAFSSSPFVVGDIAAQNASTASSTTIGAAASDYLTSYKSVFTKYSGGAVAGDLIAGVANANAGSILFQNTSSGVIFTNGDIPLIFGTQSLERMRILGANGNVGIKNTIPAVDLDVGATASAFRVSNLRTDINNGEWFGISWAGNVATIGAAANGTGVLRAVTTAGIWTFTAPVLGAATATSISTSATDFLHITTGTLANGAGVGAGTITNAPAAGNPTKWIPINDNGTARFIPAW